MAITSGPQSALSAYEQLAPHYDAFTAGYEHELWLARLVALAERHGQRGRRLLDVACGTGKSFAPLLRRGWETTACDVSPSMVAMARRRAEGRARLFVADMRALPPVGRFDLITCLDDALNYLLSQEELRSAFRGMGAQLAPHGLLVFDVNTISAYAESFSASFEHRSESLRFAWTADSANQVRPGAVLSATLAVRDDRGHTVGESRHQQRHHPLPAIDHALRDAGLLPVAVYGQRPGAVLELPPDEQQHSKLVWFARRVTPRRPAPPKPRRSTCRS